MKCQSPQHEACPGSAPPMWFDCSAQRKRSARLQPAQLESSRKQTPTSQTERGKNHLFSAETNYRCLLEVRNQPRLQIKIRILLLQQTVFIVFKFTLLQLIVKLC